MTFASPDDQIPKHRLKEAFLPIPGKKSFSPSFNYLFKIPLYLTYTTQPKKPAECAFQRNPENERKKKAAAKDSEVHLSKKRERERIKLGRRIKPVKKQLRGKVGENKNK